MEFLMHLEDHRAASQQEIKYGLVVLEALDHWIDTEQAEFPYRLWDFGISFRTRLSVLRQDLKFFNHQLERTEKELDGNQASLRHRFQTAQDVRLYRITILVALILPVFFVRHKE